MTVRAALESAAQALSTLGLTKDRALDTATGSLCLGAALEYGAGLTSLHSEVTSRRVLATPLYGPPGGERPPVPTQVARVLDQLPRVVAPHLPPWERPLTRSAWGKIIDWNDNYCTGSEDAVLVLKTALAALDDANV